MNFDIKLYNDGLQLPYSGYEGLDIDDTIDELLGYNFIKPDYTREQLTEELSSLKGTSSRSYGSKYCEVVVSLSR
jgi:hypothetical protein